jgi:hypothetical protein
MLIAESVGGVLVELLAVCARAFVYVLKMDAFLCVLLVFVAVWGWELCKAIRRFYTPKEREWTPPEYRRRHSGGKPQVTVTEEQAEKWLDNLK